MKKLVLLNKCDGIAVHAVHGNTKMFSKPLNKFSDVESVPLVIKVKEEVTWNATHQLLVKRGVLVEAVCYLENSLLLEIDPKQLHKVFQRNTLNWQMLPLKVN